MNKSPSTVKTVVSALRYSFAFCLRNNRRDTINEFALVAGLSIFSFVLVQATGSLITAIQKHLTGPHYATFTLEHFISGNFALPALIFIAMKYGLVILQRVQSAVSRRRGHVLRNAHDIEVKAMKAKLDVGRVHSEEYDNLRRKINDLPNGWLTRIQFTNSSMEVLAEVASLLMFGVALAWTNPAYFSIIVLLCLPMIFAEFAAVNKDWKLTQELVPVHKRRSVLESPFHGDMNFVQGIMFNQLGSLLKAIRTNFNEVEKRYDELRWASVQTTLMAHLIAVTGLCAVFIHAIWMALSKGADIGALTILIASLDRLVGSIRGIVKQLASQWISAQGVIMIEEQFLGQKPLLITEHPVEPDFTEPPAIAFEKVCASYPGKDALVLKDVSFRIHPRERVVIVGGNGGGKSTLLHILLRFMDPVSGRVTIGSISLRQILPVVWYRSISALTQRFVINDRLISDEVASSDMDRSKDMGKVEWAARFAEFMSVVEKKPHGFSTQLGTDHGGEDLSGGEERRLAIARLMYRGTPILIFDEPEANLDPNAAHKILERIFALKDRTVIIATQRVVEAQRADRILVMNNGELIGNGSHEELVESCEYYRNLFEQDVEDRRRKRVGSE